MLYLRNTNQQQSLDRGIRRGPTVTTSTISASLVTNQFSSSFYVLDDGATQFAATSSFSGSFVAISNSIISASVSGSAPSNVSLIISSSDGSLYFTGSSTGSEVNFNFPSIGGVNYLISAQVTSGSLVPTGQGLYRTSYTGYFADNPNWFETASVIAGGANTSPIALGSATGSGNNFSIEWKGYFTPSTTELYTFINTSDDASYVWLGGAATASVMQTSTALINNGGVHSVQTVTGSISLVSGSLYPMRIQYGEFTGGEEFTMSFYTPTIATSSNFTGYITYNTSSNGF